MEGLEVSHFGGAFRGRKVLLTGHTGFKGSWLALWLQQLGAEVVGLALPPDTQPSHWNLLKLDVEERQLDIRDYAVVQKMVAQVQPDIVFHLAAQALVRRSYTDPLTTWATNVQGTAHVLEACRQAGNVRAIVVVTTDKCYENQEWLWGYRENDRLGGHDPYSASKAGAELVAASYRKSYFSGENSPLLATARAGNVIGGGDWSQDRLIPDLVRASSCGESVEIRSPQATRPWQHVLESLSGYLLLGQRLLERQPEYAEAWNFGPDESGNQPVSAVLSKLTQSWGELRWHVTGAPQPHEASLLQLDSTKARTLLRWLPVWGLDEGLRQTASWYRAYGEKGDVISRQQLADYVAAAKAKNIGWAV
ncbi:CDP-glucose 4,6-dehydratase [Polaromonas sp.]|uniref:CDP-glucose 4,6-dehydratase n=1 Tax=Polaromonas sp. TaxID=1869339 RepID=UPI00273216D7|nr:CDP-glucose 4,6-dehydratase [Polaromonas sp.]MDP1740200.1 CDP-glucose 4,6-dehydratase [Polaromonas sp.]